MSQTSFDMNSAIAYCSIIANIAVLPLNIILILLYHCDPDASIIKTICFCLIVSGTATGILLFTLWEYDCASNCLFMILIDGSNFQRCCQNGWKGW